MAVTLAMLRNYPLAARTHVRPMSCATLVSEGITRYPNLALALVPDGIMCVPKLVTDRYVNDGVPLVARQKIPARSSWAESHRALPCLDGLIFDVARCSGASLAKHPQRQVSNLIGRDALVQD